MSIELFKPIISSRGAILPNSDGQNLFQIYVGLAFAVNNMSLPLELWYFNFLYLITSGTAGAGNANSPEYQFFPIPRNFL